MLYRATLLLIAVTAFAGTPKVAAESSVLLLTQGQSTLPREVWYGAKSLVTSMFHNIGVRVAWQAGNPPAGTLAGRIVIRIHFVDSPSATVDDGHACTPHAALACAWPFHSGTPSTVVIVSGRLRSVSRKPRLLPSLLAHVIAHEIAHIVQLRDVHSDSGIMKEHWTTQDFDRMEVLPFAFLPRDLQFIQEGFDHRRARLAPD